MRTFLAVLALVASLPAAAAQAGQSETTVSLAITPYDAPIRPESGVVSIPVEVSYTALAIPTVVPTAVSVVVAEAPPWAIVSVSPSTVFLHPPTATAGVAGTTTATVNLLVSTTADAPAFTPASLTLVATARANGVHKESSGADTTLVTAAWFGLLHGKALDDEVRSDRGEARALARVVNFGNGNTAVSFETLHAPDGAEVRLPAPVVLESKQAGGKATSATVPIRVLGGGPGEVVVRATPRYALDAGIVGTPTEIRFDVLAADGPAIFEVQGGVGGAGGLAVPVWTGILGALAGAGLYLARPARRHGIGKP